MEALENFRPRISDIVLTDLKMEMDGLQLLQAVKEVLPATELVMITGYATVAPRWD